MRGANVARVVQAHVETWRPYTLWYVGLVGLGGAALAGGPHEPWRLLAAWAAPTAGWLGGHYLGDYFDRELDAGSKPHRPIPSGRLSVSAALFCGYGWFAILAILAVLGGWGTTSAAVLGAFGIVAYSRWFKARGLAGNLVRGALGAVALFYGALTAGFSALTGSTLTALVVLMIAFWSHDAMSNLVGALRDIDGDSAGGYLTLPVRRGTPFAVDTVVALYLLVLATAVSGGLIYRSGNWVTHVLTLLVVAALGAVALVPLVAHRADMTPAIALRAHSVLVVERVVLASAVVGLGLGVGWQLALVVPMVVATYWIQVVMRTRHEFGGRFLTAPARQVSMEDAS